MHGNSNIKCCFDIDINFQEYISFISYELCYWLPSHIYTFFVFDLYTLYRLWYLWLHTTGMNHLKIITAILAGDCWRLVKRTHYEAPHYYLLFSLLSYLYWAQLCPSTPCSSNVQDQISLRSVTTVLIQVAGNEARCSGPNWNLIIQGLKMLNNGSGLSSKWTGRSSGHWNVVLYNCPDHLTQVVSHET